MSEHTRRPRQPKRIVTPSQSTLSPTNHPPDSPVSSAPEPRFRHDFSKMRTFTDDQAAEIAAAEVPQFNDHTLPQHSTSISATPPVLLTPGVANLQRETTETAGTGSAPATERVGDSLWATDDKGKPLPPSLDDISQGGVNDCFLFAAMAAIVNTDPDQIVKMIRDNGNGTYTVTFKGIGFLSSAQQTVSADFVVGQHGNVTARKAIWPLIIEKAYAQEKGGLEKLNKGGNPGSAVDDMLDEGPSRFDPRDKTADYIMGKVAKAKEKKWPMTMLAPKKEGAGKEKKEMADKTPGLYFWHAYTIIDVDPKTNRIKLFNPWGRDHPNGDGWMDVEQVRQFFIEININD